MIVPPVPTPPTKTSTAPSVSVPDLRAGRRLVDRRVGRVLELAHRHVAVRLGGVQLLGPGDRARHAERPRRQHQLGAEGDQDLAPLHAHRLGHGQHAVVAARGGGEGERDAGVAAGGLEDRLARLEQAPLLGVPDHRGADAALHRVGRVAALDLGEHPSPRALGETADLDQRRVADRAGVVFEDVGHGESLPVVARSLDQARREGVGSPAGGRGRRSRKPPGRVVPRAPVARSVSRPKASRFKTFGREVRWPTRPYRRVCSGLRRGASRSEP